MRVFAIFLQLFALYCTTGQSDTDAKPAAAVAVTKTTSKESEEPSKSKIVEKLQSAKYDNPNYVRDRLKNEMYKPQYPALSERYTKPYHPAWQDYCDPYHCNDYHLTACGLHRKKMRFQWFQSKCHLILNNQCAAFRGALKYDLVENKYCQVYIMHLRSPCAECVKDMDGEDELVCAVSRSTSRVMVFRNRCTMEKVNCENGNTDYEEVYMFLCDFYLKYLMK